MVVRNGTSDPETLSGSNDSDTLRGNAGNDELNGFDGSDSLSGGTGDDQLWAGWGDDTLVGGDGNDALHADAGINLAYGGAGDDTFLLNSINFGGLTTAYGGSGADLFSLFEISGATIEGGAGIDVLGLFCPTGTALYVDFAAGIVTKDGGFSGGLVYSGVERLTVLSFTGADTILGSDLNDAVDVGRGANQVFAGTGNDDVRYIAHTANTLDGGLGEDTLTVQAVDSPLYFIVDTFDGSVDDGQLSLITGFETFHVYGGIQNDIASLDAGNDIFLGQEGADTAFGNQGADSLSGGRNADSLQGGDGNDTLIGGNENDSLTGGTGDDRLAGGLGLDMIDGGLGRDRILLYLGDDTVTGGAGADRFVFYANETGTHTITDFASGADRLMFNAALLQFGPGTGPLDPALLSIGAATGGQAQFVLTYDALAGQSTLHWDPNGDDPAGGTYALARFSGEVTLTAADIFIL